MATKHLKLKSAVSVPYVGGRHRAQDAGDTVNFDELDPSFQDRWNDGDPWLQNLFEEADGPAEATPHTDPALTQMEIVDRLTRERAVIPVEERLGGGPRPSQTDPHRTLPESGADIVADVRFRDTEGADTSERAADFGSEATDPPEGEDHLHPADGAPQAVTDIPGPDEEAHDPGRTPEGEKKGDEKKADEKKADEKKDK